MATFFYDGQIRRYIGQLIRMLSGFKYETAEGKQLTVPVSYGDMTRQVSSIIRENSENKLISAPKIALYITDLALDRTRLSDATHVSKIHIREREPVLNEAGEIIDYLPIQGNQYTVERLMPTPYKLTVKADIWSSNTNQKLQIFEQILMLFNPSIEIQTTDNFIDWSSLANVELTNVNFSSRSIPVGVDSEIDIGTLTFETPIWINPPTKVKRMGVIHDIIMNIHDNNYSFDTDVRVSIGGFHIFVYYDPTMQQHHAELLTQDVAVEKLSDTELQIWKKHGADLNWQILLSQYPGKFRAGSSQLFLSQANGNEVIGTVALNLLDETKLIVNFDQDTYPSNTLISSSVYPSPTGRTNVDAIINPGIYNPKDAVPGTRFLILEDIGDPINADGADAWKSVDGQDFYAKANDIIEWNGTSWEVVFDAATTEQIVYTTNLKTGVQYKFEAHEWTRSFEGVYHTGYWKLML